MLEKNKILAGYDPNGIAVYVECLTNNNNRTVGNIRSIFTRSGGSLGTNGSLSFLFETKGVFTVPQKDMDPDELIPALNDAMTGKNVVAKELIASLTNIIQGKPSKQDTIEPATPLSELTPREQEILAHIAEGESNKVIARHLGISDGTVKLHVKAILRKLGVHSRVEAAVIAVEHGMRI
mgnify:CR=1 FL=1